MGSSGKPKLSNIFAEAVGHVGSTAMNLIIIEKVY